MDNAQSSGSAGSSGAAPSSKDPTLQHSQYTLVMAKNAICDVCNQRNRRTMQKCTTCSLTTCSVCHSQGRYDGRHNLANTDLPWSRNTASPVRGRGSGRGGRSGLVRRSASEGAQISSTAAPAPPAGPPAGPPARLPAAPSAGRLAATPVGLPARLPASLPSALPAGLPAIVHAGTSAVAVAPTAPTAPAAQKAPAGLAEILPMTNVSAVAAVPAGAALPSPARLESRGAPRSEMRDAFDHDELFSGLLQEWNHSPIIARVRQEEGPMQALDMVEAAATMMAMARGVPFSTNSAAWLRRMRSYYSTA
ncbi:hypothetical protein PG988_008976 [Apiospora saccharicola]